MCSFGDVLESDDDVIEVLVLEVIRLVFEWDLVERGIEVFDKLWEWWFVFFCRRLGFILVVFDFLELIGGWWTEVESDC